MRDGKARIPTSKEFDRLLVVVAAGTNAERNTAMLMLSYGLGLRVGEIASLNLGDVLGEDGKIKDGFTIRKSNSKTNKARELYLSNRKVVLSLQTYVKVLRERGDVFLDGELFRSQKGHRFTANVLQMLFHRLYKAAGLEGCKSHSGRRSFATKLLQEGTDIKSVQTLMGHANVKMTVEYVENSPEILRKAAKGAI